MCDTFFRAGFSALKCHWPFFCLNCGNATWANLSLNFKEMKPSQPQASSSLWFNPIPMFVCSFTIWTALTTFPSAVPGEKEQRCETIVSTTQESLLAFKCHLNRLYFVTELIIQNLCSHFHLNKNTQFWVKAAEELSGKWKTLHCLNLWVFMKGNKSTENSIQFEIYLYV